ncbi:MAG: 30S ribosomal protein S16 [Candidatus Cloacimonadota bacterium]|nr:MAG: 30S ribosomal protein S16 [Candidatus Cloacimonadota bacterium]PIE78842.1 MAG: 30S ribosomal protein S16 [Candidatus Delongbacteria bacterium]
MGRKKRPYYRIVAVDSRKRRDGAYIEKIGTYNPVAHQAEFETAIDHEKALKWLMVGAQPTDTVKNIFSRHGIMLKFDMMKRVKREKVDGKWKAVKDADGKPVMKFTAEEIEKAFNEWESVQEAKRERIAKKKEQKLSKKAKAKLAEKANESNEEKAEQC